MNRKLVITSAVVLILALLLTLAPACGNGEEEATPTPGVTPTPGTTPTATPKVETLKIGFMSPLSGPAAVYGVQYEVGCKWAADKINEAGGIAAGNTTYMIKIVSCDDKITASGSAQCWSRLVHNEGIRFLIGPIGKTCVSATMDKTNEDKVIQIDAGSYLGVSPEYPYRFEGYPIGPDGAWATTYMGMVLEQHPEISNMCIVNQNTNTETYVASELVAAEFYGIEVECVELFERGTQDFFPLLTRVVAKRPDAINFSSTWAGQVPYMIKTARQLGYEGFIYGTVTTDMELMLDVAGADMAEGYLLQMPDPSYDGWPEETKALFLEFQSRYDFPIQPTTIAGFDGVLMIARGVAAAGSIDVDAVLAVLNQPGFKFDSFGVEVELGGKESYGIAHVMPMPISCTEIRDGEVVQIGYKWGEIP